MARRPALVTRTWVIWSDERSGVIGSHVDDVDAPSAGAGQPRDGRPVSGHHGATAPQRDLDDHSVDGARVG